MIHEAVDDGVLLSVFLTCCIACFLLRFLCVNDSALSCFLGSR